MNRRGFLSTLAGALLASSQLDPEKALWVPGKKLISIPQPSLSIELVVVNRLHSIDANGNFRFHIDAIIPPFPRLIDGNRAALQSSPPDRLAT